MSFIDGMYHRILCNHHTGYAIVRCLQVIIRLCKIYRDMMAKLLACNDQRMKIVCDFLLLIEIRYGQIEDVIE